MRPIRPSAQQPLVLIQRDSCHLCDLAWEVLAQAGVADFESVWIDGNIELETRYGKRVPVLRFNDGRELDWPFDAAAVENHLNDVA